jgi:hypothetical protein
MATEGNGIGCAWRIGTRQTEDLHLRGACQAPHLTRLYRSTVHHAWHTNKKAGRILILPALVYLRHVGVAEQGRTVIGDPKRQQQPYGPPRIF